MTANINPENINPSIIAINIAAFGSCNQIENKNKKNNNFQFFCLPCHILFFVFEIIAFTRLVKIPEAIGVAGAMCIVGRIACYPPWKKSHRRDFNDGHSTSK